MERNIKLVVLNENGEEIKKPMSEVLKEKACEVFTVVKKKGGEAYGWCVEHKDELIGLVPLALAVIGVAKKAAPTKQETERERIDHTYYDPRTGMHWQLRRKLSNSERAELARRQRCGEYTEDILEGMRVLK